MVSGENRRRRRIFGLRIPHIPRMLIGVGGGQSRLLQREPITQPVCALRSGATGAPKMALAATLNERSNVALWHKADMT